MSLARVAAPSRSALRSQSAAFLAKRAFTTQKADNITVAAHDDGAPTASVTVAVRAGPRYETSPGLANALKHYAFKSNAKRSALRTVRESELYGGLLSASLTKETLLLSTEFLKGDEDYFVELLGDLVASSRFVQHEFDEEVTPAMRSEYEQISNDPVVLGFDVLTQTAYRQRGLGASLFASPAAPVLNSKVSAFGKAAYSRSNIAVLGSGIDASKLSSLVSKSFSGVPLSGEAAIAAGPAKYFGGEQRVAHVAHGSAGPHAHNGHFFIAFEGTAAPEFAVLRSLLGGESSVKWSKGISPLSKVGENIAGSHAEAFNLAYSDAGLFGVYITAPHARVADVAKEAVNAIKSAASSVSAEDLQRAVAKAKFEAASKLENKETQKAVVGSSLLQTGKVASLDETFSQLEGVKANAVSSAASKALKGKITTVALGNVHELPYADDIL